MNNHDQLIRQSLDRVRSNPKSMKKTFKKLDAKKMLENCYSDGDNIYIDIDNKTYILFLIHTHIQITNLQYEPIACVSALTKLGMI
jgi:hypothetical protein